MSFISDSGITCFDSGFTLCDSVITPYDNDTTLFDSDYEPLSMMTKNTQDDYMIQYLYTVKPLTNRW